mmetsp:Transcript_13138/g.25851  ORF Transcript_13138/g.25851 Transcript_13138/m.25851 type:complete len:90 (-) Transcript_13138:759-1028(-)
MSGSTFTHPHCHWQIRRQKTSSRATVVLQRRYQEKKKKKKKKSRNRSDTEAVSSNNMLSLNHSSMHQRDAYKQQLIDRPYEPSLFRSTN